MNFPWPPMPRTLSLAPSAVHIFARSTDLPPGQIAHCQSLLSNDERQKIAQLRIPAKRAESLISRALLRQVLSHFLHTAPQQITFQLNPHGKPFLEKVPLHFNLSHTTGIVLLAVSLDLPLGIDIECIDPHIACEEIAQRFFTPAEHAALLALPQSDRPAAFYRCWTRKEALLKATGEGISAGLANTTVPLHATPRPIPVGPWFLHPIPTAPEYRAALAIESSDAPLHFWSFPFPAN